MTNEILFFPRKKLKMQRIHSGNWKSKAWFIVDRLEEKVTTLECPTSESWQGITSGLRSAIIQEKSGEYIRLKGVAPKIFRSYLNQPCNFRGLLTPTEATREYQQCVLFNSYQCSEITMKPGFIEVFMPHDSDRESYKINAKFFGIIEDPRIECTNLNFKQLVNNIAKAEEFYQKRGYRREYHVSFVAGFKIKGDTRLDETFYEMTKNELSGNKKLERDQILKDLSFNAGHALFLLNSHGYTWGANLKATNSHIGNFVVESIKRKIKVNLVDLAATKAIDYFGGEKKFLKHLETDLRYFKKDFYAEYTTSLPTCLPFKYFEKELRENCWNSFLTGYYCELTTSPESYLKEMKIIRDFNLTTPPKNSMSEKEFREKLRIITN